MKMPFILFFIAGMAPTAKEREAAIEVGTVAFRNASAIYPDDKPERCDAVAGDCIPEQYAAKPVVDTFADAMEIMREKARADHATALAELEANGQPIEETPVPAEGEQAKKPSGKAAKVPAWTPNA